jgi:preprotein translocase subunit YajC
MQLVLPLLLLGAAYFALVVPQRRRAQAQRNLAASIEPGDKVVTAGGLIGRVVAVTGDRARIELAPGVEVEFLAQSVVRRLADEQRSEDAPTEPGAPDDRP